MNKLILTYLRSCTLLLLVVLSPNALAEAYLIQEGPLMELSRTHLNINDSKYRISPTVKVILKSNLVARLDDLSVGDYIEASIIKIGDSIMVDTIQITEPEKEKEL